jgi:hypothetical protein
MPLMNAFSSPCAIRGLNTLNERGLVGCQIGLELNMDIAGSMINKDTAAHVHLALLGFALATEQSASIQADEVIHGDTLPRKEPILPKGIHTVLDRRL